MNKYTTSWNPQTNTWDNGAPEFTYHRFWSQVDIATAYAEYDRLIAGGGGGPVDPVAPKAPTNLKAVSGDATVTLTWNNSTGADSYTVKRANVSGGAYTDIATVSTNTYTDLSVSNDTTYYYVVSAANAVGSSPNSAEVNATPTATPIPATGDLTVQYRTNDTSANDNQIRAHFKVINNGDEAISLSNVKLRYYYTIDGDKAQQFNCDYAVVGSSNVSGSFVKLNTAVTGADYYLEISFGPNAGTLAPGADSGEIQIRINKSDWSNYAEADDYSRDANKSSYTDWEKVSAYLNGSLVWGLEP
ncbi:Exoglucanase-2 precursor [compost metagenome]